MDNPFEGYAVIDLEMIYKLDKYLDDKQAEYLPVLPISHTSAWLSPVPPLAGTKLRSIG